MPTELFIFALSLLIFTVMDLTLNEMRALKRFAEDAVACKSHSAMIDKYPDVKERWEIIEMYLRSNKLGSDYGSEEWTFHVGQSEALACRLNDLIEDEERHQRDASKMAWASWLSSLAAVVSALAAIVALCAR